MVEENHNKNSDCLNQGLTKTLKLYLIASNRYESIGCFKDNTTSPAIETLEGKDDILDGNYSTRNDSIDKCFRAAERQRFHIFAVQDGGRCQASASAIKTFHKYNQSSQKCPSGGKGGKQINHVYYIKGKSVIFYFIPSYPCYNSSASQGWNYGSPWFGFSCPKKLITPCFSKTKQQLLFMLLFSFTKNSVDIEILCFKDILLKLLFQ